MINNNLGLYSAKILFELMQDILFFPFWWFSVGLYQFAKTLIGFLKNQIKSLALSVWIKNLFVPMYGQTDWQGRLVSILVRLAQIISRTLIFICYVVISILLLIVWIILPFVVVFEMFYQILPV